MTAAEKESWNGKQDALIFDSAPTSGSTNPVTSGGVHTALSAKANASTLSSHTGNKSNPHGVTAEQAGADPAGTAESAVAAHNESTTAHSDIRTAMNGKQDALTFDSAPTGGSDNPVTSGGVYTALAGKEASGTAASLINRSTAVNAADTNYSSYMARGEALFSADTTPGVNGAIAWIYG